MEKKFIKIETILAIIFIILLLICTIYYYNVARDINSKVNVIVNSSSTLLQLLSIFVWMGSAGYAILSTLYLCVFLLEIVNLIVYLFNRKDNTTVYIIFSILFIIIGSIVAYLCITAIDNSFIGTLNIIILIIFALYVLIKIHNFKFLKKDQLNTSN